MIRQLSEIPLRERKHAKTRLDLQRALLEKLEQKPFAAVSVKELAESISISEVTFFNYFPKKTDLVFYMLQIWAIEGLIYVRERVKGDSSNLEKIRLFFDYGHECVMRSPRVTMEIMAFVSTAFMDMEYQEAVVSDVKNAIQNNPEVAEKMSKETIPMFAPLSDAEWRLAFPNIIDIDDDLIRVGVCGLRSILFPWISSAIENGELPPKTDSFQVFFMLLAYFHGFAIVEAQMCSFGKMCSGVEMPQMNCREQLDVIFSGFKNQVVSEKSTL